MPLVEMKKNKNYNLILWKIEEDLSTLTALLNPNNTEKEALEKINHTQRRKQNIVARIMINYVSKQKNPLKYLKNGKPYCEKFKNISISHSKDYCVLITSQKTVGVDIQYKKDNILNLSEKFINKFDPHFINKDTLLANLHFVWCAKEAIYKTLIQKNCSLHQDIYIENISSSNGWGNYIKNNVKTRYSINFNTLDNYFIAVAQKDD